MSETVGEILDGRESVTFRPYNYALKGPCDYWRTRWTVIGLDGLLNRVVCEESLWPSGGVCSTTYRHVSEKQWEDAKAGCAKLHEAAP